MKKFGFLTILALFSLVTLVMASCNNTSTPAPAEKVVDISDLPPLYKSGEVREFASCSTATYRWMSCDSVLHPGTKFVPGTPRFVIAQGQKVDLGKILGVNDDNELVLREKAKTSPAPTVTKPKPLVETPPAPVKEDDSASLWSNIPWHWLGYILLAGLAALLLFLFWGLLRRFLDWATSPLSHRSVQTHTSVTEHHHEDRGRVHNTIRFKDRGPNPTEFSVEGNFHIPLEVKVNVKGEVDTFRFGYPNDGQQDRPNNSGRRYRDDR